MAELTPARRLGLLPARRRGLAVLAGVHPGAARESNTTRFDAGCVQWQAARWLVECGFAYYPSGSKLVALTAAGVELARSEGLLR